MPAALATEAYTMKRILITGGAGFIGYHLAKRLAAHRHDITLADNFCRGKRDDDFEALLKLPSVHLIETDLTQKEAWDSIGNGYAEVYHLAGINGTKSFYEIPHEVLRVGISTTMHGLEWFRAQNNSANAKILYASSNETYASALEAFGALPLPTPEHVPLVIADPYNPRWSYAGQKLVGELLFIHYARAYNFRHVIVRPHNFYGPRAGYEHAIPGLIGRIARKQEPFDLFGADETRSFCYIDDAVEAMQRVMESPITDGGTYHIGTSEETKVRDLAYLLFSLMGSKPQEVIARESPKGSVKRRLPDVSKIKRDAGWEAKTPLRVGLQRTIDWYLTHPEREGQR